MSMPPEGETGSTRFVPERILRFHTIGTDAQIWDTNEQAN